MPTRATIGACALGLALLVSCAQPPAPVAYRLPSAAPEPPVAASAIHDYPSAAGAIVGVLVRTLQLPMPAYTMEVYGDSGAFEQGLVQHLRLPPDSARSAAGFAKAAVGNRRILVNDPLLSKVDWPERIVTLAHEMVHASQLELAGHRSLVRYQWLTEGSAEWAAFRVADALGTRSLAAERAATVTRVRAARAGAGLAPLAEMDTLPQWIETRRQRGFDATYGYAWLAADFLVQRHSHDRLLAYFRSFRDSPDPAVNFRAAFGEDLAAFEAALAAHLQQLLQ